MSDPYSSIFHPGKRRTWKVKRDSEGKLSTQKLEALEKARESRKRKAAVRKLEKERIVEQSLKEDPPQRPPRLFRQTAVYWRRPIIVTEHGLGGGRDDGSWGGPGEEGAAESGAEGAFEEIERDIERIRQAGGGGATSPELEQPPTPANATNISVFPFHSPFRRQEKGVGL